MGGGASAVAGSDVRDTFMNTVKVGGLTNPYGLAAVAATGQVESGWSQGNLQRAWNDKGKPSGGAMSWRAERLQNMVNSTRGADNPAEAQARFFLSEDPALIERLNQARSPEEANALMARAWRFEGYNDPQQSLLCEALGADPAIRQPIRTRVSALRSAPDGLCANGGSRSHPGRPSRCSGPYAGSSGPLHARPPACPSWPGRAGRAYPRRYHRACGGAGSDGLAWGWRRPATGRSDFAG